MYMYVSIFNPFPNVTVTPLPSWEKVASPVVFARLVRERKGTPGLEHFPWVFSLFQCLSRLRAEKKGMLFPYLLGLCSDHVKSGPYISL